MDSPTSQQGDPLPTFYVGQHESKRALPVTDQVLQQAQDCNYDMLTTPITTPHFHSGVLTLLSNYNQAVSATGTPAAVPLPIIPALTPEDTPLTPSDTVSQLIALTSPWIDLASPDPVIAQLSWQVFNQEIAYAAFCGCVNVIVEGPKLHHGNHHGVGIAQFARAVQEALNIGPYLRIHIRLPMTDNPSEEKEEDVGDLSRFTSAQYTGKDEKRKADLYGTWDAWNVIRRVCDYNTRLSIALTLPRRLPPVAIQSRWVSEPIRILVLPGSSFLTNARGSQVLSRPHQAYISRCMRLSTFPWILLWDVGPIPGLNDPAELATFATGHLSPATAADAPLASPTPAEAKALAAAAKKHKYTDPTPHLSYIRYLQRHQPPPPPTHRYTVGYQDYLQSPLQPLTDNLESITYEVFEKDPIKYAWYERAIHLALQDFQRLGKPTSGPDGSVCIAVAGAGRGPLVARAMNAARSAGVKCTFWAVEKNPQAYVLLQRHNLGQWKGQVSVVKSDMRAWRGPVLPDGRVGHVDILVSELLGSFADNELSPECLDGVQHVLAPGTGISIPQSYTAHVSPLAAPKLHQDLRAREKSDEHAWDIPYVVLLHAVDYLSTTTTTSPTPSISKPSAAAATDPEQHPAPPLVHETWQFHHPLPGPVLAAAASRRGGAAAGGSGGVAGGEGGNEHNARFYRGVFPVRHRGLCHGLGGWFESVLYRQEQQPGTATSGTEPEAVELSTNPLTMDAKSRDMISWFPIFFPLKNPVYVPDGGELEVQMWRLTDDRKVWYEWMVEAFAVLHPGGHRVRLGGSELQSSREAGCLM